MGSRGRHALVDEHARAQGLEASRVAWPRDTTSFALLGNSMARCILQRLIHRILCTWGIFKGPDPWEMATAQARLRAEACRQPPAPPPRAPLAPQADLAWERLQQALLDPARGGCYAEHTMQKGPTARMGPGRSPRRGTPLSARLPWEAAVATWAGLVGLRPLTEPQRKRSRQGTMLRSGGPWAASSWGGGGGGGNPPTEGSTFLGDGLR